jgi:hypothetical protein
MVRWLIQKASTLIIRYQLYDDVLHLQINGCHEAIEAMIRMCGAEALQGFVPPQVTQNTLVITSLNVMDLPE